MVLLLEQPWFYKLNVVLNNNRTMVLLLEQPWFYKLNVVLNNNNHGFKGRYLETKTLRVCHICPNPRSPVSSVSTNEPRGPLPRNV